MQTAAAGQQRHGRAVVTGLMSGHSDAVTCLAHRQGVVASGSDDGTCRLFDVGSCAPDTPHARAQRCIAGVGGPVSAVALAEHRLWAATGHVVLCYDLRRTDVVLQQHQHRYAWSQDEVNHVSHGWERGRW